MEFIEQKLTLDDFKLWRVDALKDFLWEHALKPTDRKDELSALAYSAGLMNIPLICTVDEIDKQKSKNYKCLLTCSEGQILDPINDVTENWIDEETGLKCWRPTLQFYIAEYLLGSNFENDKDLTRRLMTDYKEGKAYIHTLVAVGLDKFTTIASHHSPNIAFSSLNPCNHKKSTTHHIRWILVEKTTGRVHIHKSSYCTCFARYVVCSQS